MKKINLIILSMLLLFTFLSCSNDNSSLIQEYLIQQMISNSMKSSSSSKLLLTPYTSISGTSYKTSVATSASQTYNSDDLVENTTFAYTVSIDLSNMQASCNGDSFTINSTNQTLLSNTIAINSSNGITITSTYDGYIKYSLSGNLNGTFKIAASDKKYAIELNNTTISATDGPALNLSSKKRTFIIIPANATNTLTDSTSRTTDTSKAAIFSKGQLIFTGSTSSAEGGTLTVNASYKHGIYSNDYVRFQNATYNINSSSRDCIRSVNRIIIDDGTFAINGTGTTQDDESKGIKVEGEESEDGKGLGDIVINGGRIDINTVSKGITAAFDSDEDGDTSSTAYDPAATVTINHGYITVTTTGTPYEGDGISLSPEGIEGKGGLTINDGYIVINSTDDCINVSNSKNLTINNGYVYCYSSNNDAIDSNGNLYLNGGVIVATGTTTPECAFDCDNNTFGVTGGILIGLGTSNYSSPTSSATTQNTIQASSSSITAIQTFAICNSSGTPVFAYTIPCYYDVAILSSPLLTNGTYTLVNGVTIDNKDSVFYGLYTDPSAVSISGGTSSSFTISGNITTIGTISNNGPQEGTPGRPF